VARPARSHHQQQKRDHVAHCQIRPSVETNRDVVDTVKKVRDLVAELHKPPTNPSCRTTDPKTRACRCDDVEYNEWKRGSTYNPQGPELVAVHAFLTPLTIGTGYTAPSFIALIKSISAAFSKPHCYARLNDEAATALKRDIDTALSRMT
jgi:hypothetical protein